MILVLTVFFKATSMLKERFCEYWLHKSLQIRKTVFVACRSQIVKKVRQHMIMSNSICRFLGECGTTTFQLRTFLKWFLGCWSFKFQDVNEMIKSRKSGGNLQIAKNFVVIRPLREVGKHQKGNFSPLRIEPGPLGDFPSC